MSNKTEKETAVEAKNSDALETKKAELFAPETMSEKPSKFGIITLILALIGIGISISGLMEIHTFGKGFQALRTELTARLDEEQAHLDGLEQSLKAIGDRQQSFDTQLTYYRSVIVPALQEKRPTDFLWQMQKVHQWLRQAQLDLHWSEDKKGALLLLNAAKNVLEQQTNVPQLAEFQTQITQAITEISSIPPIQCTKILLQLHTVSEAIRGLPSPEVNLPESTPPNSSPNKPTWSEKVWASLKKVVIIRPSNEVNTNALVISQQARQDWNTNMALYLQQAQWAFLRKDNELFHWSLSQATQLLEQSNGMVDATNSQTAQSIDTLKALSQLNLHPTLPDLTPLCQKFNGYLKTLTLTPEKTQ